MATNIKVEGIEELRKRLQTAAQEMAGKPGGNLERAMKRSVYRVVFTLADYPQQRPTSYRRTGTLGRRWFGDIKISRTGIAGIRGQASNATTYAPFVQSERFQTGVHRRNGWTTDRAALDKNSAAIDREFAIAVEKSLG